MTRKEKLLAVSLLNIAADEFSNHGCNDMDQALFDAIGFTEAEKAAMVVEFARINEHVEHPVDIHPFAEIGDWQWMAYLADRLMLDAGDTPDAL